MLKKLDRYTLRNFLVLFCGTFVICLFLVMMQFLWKYVDDLVGKGLSMLVLAKFFFFAGETLVSLALPLAILLASLISFGNMGERLELLAAKAAGISLWRMMRPLIVLMVLMTAVSFHFQDVIAPKAQNRLMSLLYSIRQKSPELDIPEGVFYDGVAGMNLFVRQKDRATGMLYGVVIYNMRDGVNNMHIIMADSGRMETSADKQCLLLHLWNGEQFENLRTNALATNNVPYRRETFVRKLFLIDFDQNFEMSDEDFSSSARTKDIGQLRAGVDSLERVIDSTAQMFYADMQRGVLNLPAAARADREELELGEDVAVDVKGGTVRKRGKRTPSDGEGGRDMETTAPATPRGEDAEVALLLPIDTMFAHMGADRQLSVMQRAAQRLNVAMGDMEFRKNVMKAYRKELRSHEIQIWQKATLSLACLIFFFIGAPLGAIIRKGGLGLPVVVAVLIFIFYYIVNSFGENLASAGTIPVWVGLWFSTAVLAPIGAFLTVKSNNDSVVFSMDSYRQFFSRLLGLRLHRHIARKEVIINDPDYPALAPRLDALVAAARAYAEGHSLKRFPNYIDVYFRHARDEQVEALAGEMEALVEELSNSRRVEVLATLGSLPILDTYAHTAPFRDRRWNRAVGLLFPVGICLLLRIWQFRLRLLHDLRQVAEIGTKLATFCREDKTQPHG